MTKQDTARRLKVFSIDISANKNPVKSIKFEGLSYFDRPSFFVLFLRIVCKTVCIFATKCAEVLCCGIRGVKNPTDENLSGKILFAFFTHLTDTILFDFFSQLLRPF